MHTDPSSLLVLFMGLGLVLVGAVLLVTRRSLRSRLRRTPQTLARDVRVGSSVKMMGQLVAREPVHSPLADKPCAFFQMTVQQESEQDRETVEHHFTDREYAQGLELVDASGRIPVEPENARFLYIRQREFAPDSAAWEPGIRRDLVARYILGRSDERMLLREERLDLGVPVVLLGRVEEGPQGPVLTGGADLEVYGEPEHTLTALKLSDLGGWVLIASGLLLCGAWGSELGREPEPLPNLEPTPLQRPPEPTRFVPRKP